MHGFRIAAVFVVLVATGASAAASPIDVCRRAFEAAALGMRASVLEVSAAGPSIVDEAHAQRRALQRDILVVLDPTRERAHLATARLSVRDERRRMLAALPADAGASPTWEDRACATLEAGTALLAAERRQRRWMLGVAVLCSAVFVLAYARTRTSSRRPHRAEHSSG